MDWDNDGLGSVSRKTSLAPRKHFLGENSIFVIASEI